MKTKNREAVCLRIQTGESCHAAVAVCFMETWSGSVIDLGKKPPPLLIQEPDGAADDMRQ